MPEHPLARLHLAVAPTKAKRPRLPHDVASLRRMAWRLQGVAMLPVDEIGDELVRRIVEGLAIELYGPRQ